MEELQESWSVILWGCGPCYPSVPLPSMTECMNLLWINTMVLCPPGSVCDYNLELFLIFIKSLVEPNYKSKWQYNHAEENKEPIQGTCEYSTLTEHPWWDVGQGLPNCKNLPLNLVSLWSGEIVVKKFLNYFEYIVVSEWIDCYSGESGFYYWRREVWLWNGEERKYFWC